MEISGYGMRHKNTVGGQSHCEWTLRRCSTMRLMRSWLRRLSQGSLRLRPAMGSNRESFLAT